MPVLQRDFTIKFLITFIGSIFAAFAAGIITFYFTLPRSKIHHYHEAVLSLIEAKSVLVDTLVIAGIIEVIFIVFIVIFISIRSSHKIAGPIYRLEKNLHDIAEGDLTGKVRFRNHDPLKEVELTFNGALEDFSLMIKAVDEAFSGVDKARGLLNVHDMSIENFREKVNTLERELDRFKL